MVGGLILHSLSGLDNQGQAFLSSKSLFYSFFVTWCHDCVNAMLKEFGLRKILGKRRTRKTRMEHGVTAISLTSHVTRALTHLLLCWGCSNDAHRQSNWHFIDIGVMSVLPPPWWMWTHHHKTAHSRAPMTHDSIPGDLVSKRCRETLQGSWDNGANDPELTSSGRSNFSYTTDEAATSDR